MKQIFVSFFAMFIALGLGFAPLDAEARRMGGGKSFGMQRSAPTQRQAAPQQNPQQGAAPAATPQKRSWMGPLAGLAAGLGLAALMSHLGLGPQFANMLLIALAVMAAFLLFRYLTRPKVAPGMQYASGNHAPLHPTPARFDVSPASGAFSSDAPAALPPGFDAEAFTREAKVNFIRMQAANDAGNVDDIRSFTTPELFAEIRLQLSERGETAQETDVVNLNADVIECAEENNQLVASVRFHGLIREEAMQSPLPFDETWHLAKPTNGRSGWLVAGIQQN